MTTLRMIAALLFGTLGFALQTAPAHAQDEYREAGLRTTDDAYWATNGIDQIAMRFYLDRNQFHVLGFDDYNRLRTNALISAQPTGSPNSTAAAMILRDPVSGETASLYNYSAVEQVNESLTRIYMYSSLGGQWDSATLTYSGDTLLSVDNHTESAMLHKRSPAGPRIVSDFGNSSSMSSAFYTPANMAKWHARAMQDYGFQKAGWWKATKSWIKNAAKDTGKLLNDVAHSTVAKKVAVFALYGVVIIEAAACGYAIAQSGGAATAAVAKPCSVAILATLAAASATAEAADDGAARLEISRQQRLMCNGCYAIASSVFGASAVTGGRTAPVPVQ